MSNTRSQNPDLIDCYSILVRIMRQIENRHPVGHDARQAALRILKRLNQGEVLDLRCFCSACVKERKE